MMSDIAEQRYNKDRDPMKLGEKKTVFAWLPIKRTVRAWTIEYGSHYTQDGWYWLRRVTVMRTFQGLTAYAQDNDS